MFSFSVLDSMTADEFVQSGHCTLETAKELVEAFSEISETLKDYIAVKGTPYHDSDPTGYPV